MYQSLEIEAVLDQILLPQDFTKAPRSILPHANYSLSAGSHVFYASLEVETQGKDISTIEPNFFCDPPVSLVVGVNSREHRVVIELPICKKSPHSHALSYARCVQAGIVWLRAFVLTTGFFEFIETHAHEACDLTDYRFFRCPPAIF